MHPISPIQIAIWCKEESDDMTPHQHVSHQIWIQQYWKKRGVTLNAVYVNDPVVTRALAKRARQQAKRATVMAKKVLGNSDLVYMILTHLCSETVTAHVRNAGKVCKLWLNEAHRVVRMYFTSDPRKMVTRMLLVRYEIRGEVDDLYGNCFYTNSTPSYTLPGDRNKAKQKKRLLQMRHPPMHWSRR